MHYKNDWSYVRWQTFLLHEIVLLGQVNTSDFNLLALLASIDLAIEENGELSQNGLCLTALVGARRVAYRKYMQLVIFAAPFRVVLICELDVASL